MELWLFHLWQPCVKSCFSSFIPPLVCGFNPFEKYDSKWESRGENKKSLKPPPTPLLKPTPCSKKKNMFYQHPPTGWCFLHLPNGIAALMAHPVALRENSQACRLKMSFVELQHILPDLPKKTSSKCDPRSCNLEVCWVRKTLSGSLGWLF